MDIKEHTFKLLTWNYEGHGLFECQLQDGNISDLRFCRHGRYVDADGLFVGVGSEDYIRCVYRSLGELLKEIESNAKPQS